MFCRTCGKEIIDEAVICPYCGCLTGVPQQPPIEKNGSFGNSRNVTYNQTAVDQNSYPIYPNNAYNTANNSTSDEVSAGLVVLSILIPIVGIILGAVNLSDKKKSGKTYLIAGIGSWAFLFILGICLMGIGFAFAASSI